MTDPGVVTPDKNARNEVWAERLRADAAERELARANRLLARLGQIAEAWNETWGSDAISARVASQTILMTIRETP